MMDDQVDPFSVGLVLLLSVMFSVYAILIQQPEYSYFGIIIAVFGVGMMIGNHFSLRVIYGIVFLLGLSGVLRLLLIVIGQPFDPIEIPLLLVFVPVIVITFLRLRPYYVELNYPVSN